MRRVLILVVLCLSAAPAGAQPASAPRAAASGGLRGPLGLEAPSAVKAPPPARPDPALGAPPLQSAPPSPQCRSSCDKDYYFCLSQESADQCPATWSQCRAGCDAAARTSPLRPG